ncbi:alpha-glucanase [Colletotrichum tofieldiae]|uniref:Alpha-glucanase n=1 Tax=Colletotrichum tofieldiae TaxID=708197 RepID=A0A166YUL7_9PEZI|nr:alpha-glucanase [Colletotrichum tofieldiae]
MGSFEIGRAPFNYGTLLHNGWRDVLPFVIDMYKNNASSIEIQRAIEYLPDEVVDDNIVFIALLSKKAKVECIIGGHLIKAKFYQCPEGDGVGVYLGERDPGGHEGSVEVKIIRSVGFSDEFSASARGYDSLYDAYKGWVKDSLGPQLESLMAVDTGEGNQYFDYLLTLSGHKYDKTAANILG